MFENKNVYNDGKMKIEVGGILSEFAKTDELIGKLDMHQRIRILEFLSGIRDVNEVKDLEEAALVARVLGEALIGRISQELNPDTWNIQRGFEKPFGL